jgi:hypothetical protein
MIASGSSIFDLQKILRYPQDSLGFHCRGPLAFAVVPFNPGPGGPIPGVEIHPTRRCSLPSGSLRRPEKSALSSERLLRQDRRRRPSRARRQLSPTRPLQPEEVGDGEEGDRRALVARGRTAGSGSTATGAGERRVSGTAARPRTRCRVGPPRIGIAALRRLRMTGAEIAECLDMALDRLGGVDQVTVELQRRESRSPYRMRWRLPFEQLLPHRFGFPGPS